MSELLAVVGATLLGAATLPQAVDLLRGRRAGDFGWTFSILNTVGLACLLARSVVIEEWAFVAINGLTTTFWGLVVAVKVERWRSPPAPTPGETGTPSGR